MHTPQPIQQRKELFPYQLRGVQFLTERGTPATADAERYPDSFRPRALLCDEMGLGKTLQVAEACAFGYEESYTDENGDEKTVAKIHIPLVICPRVLVPMWQDTLESVGVLRYVVTYYDQLLVPKLLKYLQDKSDVFTVCICDEAHWLKEPKTKRYKNLMTFLGNIKVRWFVTGTPVVNRLPDLLALLDLLNLTKPLFGHRNNFIKDHAWNPITRKQDDHRNMDILNAKMQPYLLARKTVDVLPELPPMRYMTEVVDIGLTDESYWLEQREGENEFQYLQRLQDGVCMEKCSVSIDWINLWLESSPPEKKLVVFAHNITVQDKLLATYKHIGAAAVKASFSNEKRVYEIRRFQEEPSCRIIILSLLCGGVGITLHAADTVLFVQYPWTPALYHQACKRIHRIGQQSNLCSVYNLVLKGTIDYRQVEILVGKQEMLDAFTQTDMARILFDETKMGLVREEA